MGVGMRFDAQINHDARIAQASQRDCQAFDGLR
jgi:hypothetical protein